ncbi:MAG: hypothetical protein KAS75_02200 [Planctomycetes bacterium]|nr:hypothetical protein [Planctomycetota bacterium]
MYRKLIKILKNKNSTKPKATGFTIIEVAVASGLFIIAIVPILQALTTAHTNTLIIEHRTQSLALAQTKLNEIKVRSIYNYAANFTENDSVLDGSYLCSVIDTSVTSNLRNIEISVGYDQNVNTILEADEVDVTLMTQFAKRW